MSERDKGIIYEYLLNYHNILENEMLDCRRVVISRKCDELDILEYLISIVRIQVFREFSKDIRNLLKLY